MNSSGYPVELCLWACHRTIEEYVRKVDYLQKRKAEFEEMSLPNAMRPSTTMRAYASLARSIVVDIERYQATIDTASRFYDALYHGAGSPEQHKLDVKTLSIAFDLCQSQRVQKYAVLLGWERERVLLCALGLTGKLELERVRINDFDIDVIYSCGLSARQKLMIAKHGGRYCELNYRNIWAVMRDERAGI